MTSRIIAEVAQGYEGKPDFCDFYVRAAHKAGADAVKFQIVFADDVAEPGYQYYDWFRQLEMEVDCWRSVRRKAEKLGILFFSDISGERALSVAEQIRPDGIKIHSSNFFNRSLILRAFEISSMVFISLGGIEVSEAEEALKEIEKWGFRDRLVFLYGFQAEPTPLEKSHLNRLKILKQRFPGISIGYMDHLEGGFEDFAHLSLIAQALGAEWIEKHLTLSRFLEVEDYVSAIEADEFASYVATLRRMAEALGGCDLKLNEEERLYRDKAVKKIVASRELSAGSSLSLDDLAHLRTPRVPAFAGFHNPAQVLGRKLKRKMAKNDPILEEDLL